MPDIENVSAQERTKEITDKLEKGIKDVQEWLEKGYSLPEFDIEKVREETHRCPEWIHFGAGNIFRAFQANRIQDMLNKGLTAKGLIVVEGFDYEIIE